MAEQLIGIVTHYFGKIRVAALNITAGELRIGDTIHIKGHTSDFTQPVESLQVEHQSVDIARPGDAVALRVGEHDQVFTVTPD